MTTKQEWQSLAYFSAKRTLRKWSERFLAEDLLAMVVVDIGEPMDRRSWGGVIRSLSADRVIKRAGVGAAKSSNRSLKPYWKKIPSRSKS